MDAEMKVKDFNIIRADHRDGNKTGTTIFLHNLYLGDTNYVFPNAYCISVSPFE